MTFDENGSRSRAAAIGRLFLLVEYHQKWLLKV